MQCAAAISMYCILTLIRIQLFRGRWMLVWLGLFCLSLLQYSGYSPSGLETPDYCTVTPFHGTSMPLSYAIQSCKLTYLSVTECLRDASELARLQMHHADAPNSVLASRNPAALGSERRVDTLTPSMY